MTMAAQDAGEALSQPNRWIAAIDTASDRAGVALFDGTDASVIAWNAHRNHTVETLAQLDHLLHLGNVQLRELAGIAVGVGPGSFSALRVGVSIAKGLAFSLGIPVVGIPTTGAIAAVFAWMETPVVAVMPAGRGRVVWSVFHRGDCLEEPQNTTLAELQAALPPGALVAGETERLPDLEAVALPSGARVEQIARLGWTRLMAGEQDDIVRLEPIYVHGRRNLDAIPT